MTARSLSRQGGVKGGFTLVEMMISLGIFCILAVTVFSITIQTSAFVGDQDVEYSLLTEVNRASLRLAEVLRKSGQVTRGGNSYPRTRNQDRELEFLALNDLDGNGYFFNGATGEPEWDPRVFTVRHDPATGILSIHDATRPVWILGRYMKNVTFATYREDPSLSLKEIKVDIEAEKETRRGEMLTLNSSKRIHLRN